MSALQKIIFLLAILLAIAPGAVVVSQLLRERTRTEAFFAGALLNLVITLYIGRFFSLKLIPLLLGLEYAIALLLLILPRFKKDFFSQKCSSSEPDIAIWVITLLAFLVWWLPATSGILPMGTDPMSHMLLISKTLLTGKLPTDWAPYEALPVNMATGAHYITAFFAWLTNMPPHSVYKLLFPVISFFTTGMIYLLTKELFSNKTASILSSALWAMSTRWGGMDYLLWGDMPNFLAMLIFLSALWAIVAFEGKRRILLLGIFGAGVILINHLSAFVGLTVLITLSLFNILGERKITSTTKEILLGIALSIILLPFTLMREAWKLLSGFNEQTELFKMPEFFTGIQDIPRNMGYMVFFLGIASLIFATIKMKERKEMLVPAWGTAILCLVAVCGYLYRAFSFGLHGEFYALLRPSRILMDLSYPLCIGSAWFLAVDKTSPKLKSALLAVGYLIFFGVLTKVYPFVLSKNIFNNPALYIYIGYPIALIFLAIALLLSAPERKIKNIVATLIVILLTTEGFYRAMRIATRTGDLIKPAELQDMNVLKNSISDEHKDALLLNHPPTPDDFPIYGWLPYWTGLECSWTPLLSSEARLSQSIKFKRNWLEPNYHEAVVWSHIEARPVVAIITVGGDLSQMGFELIYQGTKRKVFLYDPAKH